MNDIKMGVFISPKFCGCRVQLAAKWIDGDLIKQDSMVVAYRHPLKNTIVDAQIISICNEHKLMLDQPLEADPYFGSRGYIDPVPRNPSPAIKLYIILFRYWGGNHAFDTCKCVGHIWRDISKEVGENNYFHHPLHSNKCKDHDGLDEKSYHVHALHDNQTKAKFIELIKQHVPRMTKKIANDDGDESIVLHHNLKLQCEFTGKNDQRKLHFKFKGIQLASHEQTLLLEKAASLKKTISISNI